MWATHDFTNAWKTIMDVFSVFTQQLVCSSTDYRHIASHPRHIKKKHITWLNCDIQSFKVLPGVFNECSEISWTTTLLNTTNVTAAGAISLSFSMIALICVYDATEYSARCVQCKHPKSRHHTYVTQNVGCNQMLWVRIKIACMVSSNCFKLGLSIPG